MLDYFQQRRLRQQPAIHSEDDYHQSIVGNVTLLFDHIIRYSITEYQGRKLSVHCDKLCGCPLQLSDVSISQGSAATRLRRGGIFSGSSYHC